MTQQNVLIEPRDPAIFRDARSFETGLGARTLSWPTPSAVIGTIRTRLGTTIGFDPAAVQRLLQIRHTGPFLACETEPGNWDLAFISPVDAIPYDATQGQVEFVPLRPSPLLAGEGLDLPVGLLPLLGARPRKESSRSPRFWRASWLLAWLQHVGAESLYRAPAEAGFPELDRQRRMHVAIMETGRNAKEGMLFSTEGLEFQQDADPERRRWELFDHKSRWPCRNSPPWIINRRAIFSRIEGDLDGLAALDGLAPIGGEQRLAYWSLVANLLPPPPRWVSSLKRIRLVLLTPGAFAQGWRPAWSDTGSPPEAPSLKLKLVGAAVPRPMPISGWDYTVRGRSAQKATRFLAPAGSVYFFEIKNGGDPAGLWLKSICDDEQSRRDGFGLVLVGAW